MATNGELFGKVLEKEDAMPQSQMTVKIRMPDKRSIGFPVVLRAKRPTCFALGVRKSGSSIFSSIVNALALHNGQANAVDIPGEMFKAGYRYTEWNAKPLTDLVWPGNVYIGFRDAPTALYADPVFRKARKILMVRDPRDALVSEYFSNAYSHSLPESGAEGSILTLQRAEALQASVADYALKRAKHLDATVEKYAALLDDPEILVMHYENVILAKDAWIRAIADHFEFEIDDDLVQAILGWADVVPKAEDEKAFVRRVVPGDHRNKLTTETIAQIDGALSDIWRKLGYAIGTTGDKI